MKVLLWLGCVGLGAQFAGAQIRTNINGIAVIVNDAIITRQEVTEYIRPAAETLFATVRDPETLDKKIFALQRDGTDDLVKRHLILNDFKTAGYNYPESIIEDRIEERIKTQYHDRAELMQTLHARQTTMESFRKQQREEILITAMRQLKLPQDIIISPQKILDFYQQHQTNYAVGDEVKLRMIVLNKPNNDKGGVKQLAEDILRKINEGALFGEMARIHSERVGGGEASWAQRDPLHPEGDTLRKELSDVAFALKPGQHSAVIDLPDACWLLEVEERRPPRTRPLSEVRDSIERELRFRESVRLEEKWIKRLKEKSFVRYF
jgi:parvulin-like peptidyl-prolyl isomerase